jgi:2-amino-4-hydroxy-6-hydroxymethyldihydropteridine diphosphokinase
MARVGIALGSNLGDRAAHLNAAIAALREISTPGEPVWVAPLYESEPFNCPPGSPPFLNTVIEIAHDGGAPAFLETMLGIEAALGRTRGPHRNAPRVIDMDLLYMGDEILTSETLALPHPGIAGRRFVLQPLADIRPELVLPGETRTVRAMLDQLADGGAPLRETGQASPTLLSDHQINSPQTPGAFPQGPAASSSS